MAENVTDVSDRSYQELAEDADYNIVQELAKEREIKANQSQEAMAREIFEYEGRTDEIGGETEDDSEEQQAISEPESDPEPATEPRALGFETIVRASAFTPYVDHLNTVVEEAKMRFRTGGIRTQAVDPANVCMVTANLGDPAWESYDVDQEYVLGLNLNRLSDMLKKADDDDLIHLDYDHERGNLELAYREHEFTISTIDPDSIRKEPDLPDLDLPVSAVLKARAVQEAVSFADDVSDHIAFEAHPGADGAGAVFSVKAEGDTDSYEATFVDGDGVEFEAYPSGHEVSRFSLDYLKVIARPYPADREITIDLGTEFPARLYGNIVIEDSDGDDLTAGRAQYMIAPRIQSD